MSATAKIQPDITTFAEYVEWENQQETRHEWIDGQIVAMTGGTTKHARLIMRLAGSLYTHLRGTPCEVFTQDLKVQAAENVFYPDLVVSCVKQNDQDFFCKDPKLIIEVLSNSTARKDRITKRLAYQQIETLDDYVLVGQELPHVIVHRRAEDWQPVILTSGALNLRSVEFSIDLDDLYA